MKLFSRYGPLLILTICSFVFASTAATPVSNTTEKQVIKQSPDAQTAIMTERAFNVEGKVMGQLTIERLDADWSAVVLPDAPVRRVDHVPLY